MSTDRVRRRSTAEEAPGQGKEEGRHGGEARTGSHARVEVSAMNNLLAKTAATADAETVSPELEDELDALLEDARSTVDDVYRQRYQEEDEHLRECSAPSTDIFGDS